MTNTEGMQLLQSFSNAVAQLAESVSPSVVNVNAGRRNGTGVVWSSDGYIVTASHVIGGSAEPTVKLSDGRELNAKVVGRDQYTDVALLKVEADRLSAIQTGSTNDVRVGQFVLALANAFGKKASATSGIVTSQSRSMRGWWGVMIEDAVVTDAKLNPGYSGGPLVDASGRMLGMNVAYFSGRGVAVSIDRSACETCHQVDFCASCHRETAPRSHRAQWGEPVDKHCLNCHFPVSAERCSVCHQDGTPSHAQAHPKPAVPVHTAGSNCRGCHGVTVRLPHVDSGDDCNACHH